jgi:hypothetical protein
MVRTNLTRAMRQPHAQAPRRKSPVFCSVNLMLKPSPVPCPTGDCAVHARRGRRGRHARGCIRRRNVKRGQRRCPFARRGRRGRSRGSRPARSRSHSRLFFHLLGQRKTRTAPPPPAGNAERGRLSSTRRTPAAPARSRGTIRWFVARREAAAARGRASRAVSIETSSAARLSRHTRPRRCGLPVNPLHRLHRPHRSLRSHPPHSALFKVRLTAPDTSRYGSFPFL